MFTIFIVSMAFRAQISLYFVLIYCTEASIKYLSKGGIFRYTSGGILVIWYFVFIQYMLNKKDNSDVLELELNETTATGDHDLSASLS